MWGAVLVVAGCASPSTSSSWATPPTGDDAGPPVTRDAGGTIEESGAADAGNVRDAGNGVDAAEAGGPPGPPVAYVTTDDLSQHLAPTPVTLGGQPGADVMVTVDTPTTDQSIVGFGASITDSSSYAMTKYLSPGALNQLLLQLFDPAQGAGLSFLRQPMGASDFSSVGDFSYDDVNSDPTLVTFNLAQAMQATIPVLKQ